MYFAEAIRDKFVSHKGQKEIEVVRNVELEDADWEDVISDFAAQIEACIGKDKASLLACDFSTSTPVDKVVSNILLLEGLQKYFRYTFRGGCGFPSIELAGTVDDWKAIRARAEKLRAFAAPPDAKPELPKDAFSSRVMAEHFGPKPGHLNAWLDDLLPVLDHFVSAAEGRPDIEFWGSLCNLPGGSGGIGAPLTGWITVFFPYLKRQQNGYLGTWRQAYAAYKAGGALKCMEESLAANEKPMSEHKIVVDAAGTEIPICAFSLDELPQAFSNVPVKWVHVGTGETAELRFFGGLATVHQNPVNGTLEARSGWAIVKKD